MSLRPPTILAGSHRSQSSAIPSTGEYRRAPYRPHYSRRVSSIVSRTATNADAETSNGPIVAPDPWLAPLEPAQPAPADAPIVADVTSVAAAPGAQVPPSPWDAPSQTTSASGHEPVPSRHAATATAAREASASAGGASHTAAAATAAAATADRPAAAGSPSVPSAATGSAAAAGATSASSGGGVSASASGGGDAGRFDVREASAALSEDTAALLARLRAELARTSNIEMPPRWTSRRAGGGGVGGNGTTVGGEKGTAGNSNGTGTSNGGSGAIGSSGGSSSSVSGVAATRSAAGPVSATGSPTGTAGSSEARAAARAAGTAAATSGSVGDTGAPKPTRSGSGAFSSSGSAAAGTTSHGEVNAATPSTAPATTGAASAAADGGGAESAEAAAAAPKQPGLAAGGLFGFLRRRRTDPEPTPPAAVPAAAASGYTDSNISTTTAAVSPPPSAASSPTASTPSASAATVPPPAQGQPTPAAASTVTSSPNSTSGGAAPSASPAGARSGTGSSSSSSSSSGSSNSAARGGGGRRRRAVVVGGGIGGLVSAARLAKEGFSVTLLEANAQLGGRCQSVQRGRFRFDTGPSLLLFIETYRKTFAALGTSLPQQVPVVRVTPAAYRVFFQGAGSMDMLYDVQRMVEQLETVERGAGAQYLEWLATARAALQLGVEGFIERDADNLGDLVGRALQDPELRSLLTSVGVPELLGTHYARMSRRFRDPRLRAMFTFQDLYVGLSPYTAPGVYSLLAATEITDGVWYPLGGFGQIRDALVRVGQSLGVRVRCGARVTAIRTAAGEGGGQRAVGVTLASGEQLDADVVVSNRDVPLTYDILRGPAETHGSAQARRILAQDYSAGVIAFNWSVNKKLEPLLHHNVFLSGDFAGSWDRATSPETLARSPNFYVHCPGRTDPTAAPPGSDSVMVLLPVANIQQIVKAQEAERRREEGPLAALSGPLAAMAAAASAASAAAAGGSGSGSGSGAGGGGAAAEAAAAAAGVSFSGLVAAGREAVLRSLAEAGMTDVRQHIVDEMVIDPLEWRDRYSLAHGAAFGLSHGLNQLSVFRPGVADKQVRGLYLVGASTRPGNGVPLTMTSADLVTQRVMQDVAAGVI